MVNFQQNTHNRHPIVCLWEQDIECLLWVQSLISFLPQSLQSCIQYPVVKVCVIIGPDCKFIDTLFNNQFQSWLILKATVIVMIIKWWGIFWWHRLYVLYFLCQFPDSPGLHGWHWEVATTYADMLADICLHGNTSNIQKVALMGKNKDVTNIHQRPPTQTPLPSAGLLDLVFFRSAHEELNGGQYSGCKWCSWGTQCTQAAYSAYMELNGGQFSGCM